MKIMLLDYDSISADGKTLKLYCPGLGEFDVISGAEQYLNNPDCSDIEKAAIPPGTYWVVDRPKGSFSNQVRAELIDLSKAYRNNHSDWFGLYNNQTMSDYVYVNGIKRGGFRLHPLDSDGSGVSWGCITLKNYDDFYTLRASLLSGKKGKVPGGKGLEAYGRIEVKGIPLFWNCKVR